MTARTLLAAALVALVGSALAQPPKVDAPKGKPDAKAEPADLNKLLAKRVTIDRFDDTFKDAVKLLADKYELPLAVDPKLGEDQGAAVAAMAVACEGVDGLQIKLPRLVNVRLDTVLKLVVEQVNAKFLVYPDHIKIVPLVYAAYESAVLTVNPSATASAGGNQTICSIGVAAFVLKYRLNAARARVDALLDRLPENVTSAAEKDLS